MRVAGSFCRTRWMPTRVEPDEREREPGPHLVLHLLEHVPRRDDEDPLAAAAPDQLGEDHADLERLAEADRVGEQDARPEVRRVERLADGGLLVGERVGEHVGRDGEGGAVERAPRSCAASPPARAGSAGSAGSRRRPPSPRAGRGRAGRVEALVEAGGGVADELGQALTRSSRPSAVCSTPVTSHSSSRTTTTEPGAMLNLAESGKVDKIRPSLPLSMRMLCVPGHRTRHAFVMLRETMPPSSSVSCCSNSILTSGAPLSACDSSCRMVPANIASDWS